MTPEELADRIRCLRIELECLIDEVTQQVGADDDGETPDTDSLMCREYMGGPPTGLQVALDALPDPDCEFPDSRTVILDGIRHALDNPGVQRQRRDKFKKATEAPAMRALTERLKK